MNKRVVAVVLAGAMATSQLVGPIEVLATQTPGEVEATASEKPEKVLEERAGVDTPEETAKDNSVQAQAEVKGLLKADGTLVGRDDSDQEDATVSATVDNVTDLLIGSGLVTIPADKFKGKTQLTKLSFMHGSDSSKSKTTTIGANAFNGTGVTTVDLPVNMATVEAGAFKGCASLATINLSGTVATIGEGAFENTGLTTVAIPVGVTSIANNTFRGATKLGSVDFSKAVNLQTIGNNAFEGAIKLLEITNLPATLTSIGNAAFKYTTSVSTVDLSTATGLTTIGESAFENSGVAAVEIPAAVTSIGNGAFQFAAELATVDLSKAAVLATIGNNAFKGAGELTGKVDLTSTKITAVGTNAFEGTQIAEVDFPATLLTIGNDAFTGVGTLTKANFQAAVNMTSIGEGAFNGCGLVTVDLSPITTVAEIKDRAFKGNQSLETATLPEKTTALKPEVFAGTALKTLEINKGCTAVDLTALPDSLETLTVASGNTAFSAEGGVLYNDTKTNLKAVPKKKGETLTIPATVTTVDANAAKGNTSLKKVDLADSSELLNIESNAFEDATELKVLDLTKATKMANVKADAFKNSGLDYMHLGEGTKVFDIVVGAFASTAKSKVAKFFKNNGDEVAPGADLIALETKWEKLKTANNGSWTFYSKPVPAPEPKAEANYDTMKLTKLTVSTNHNITVDGKTETFEADAKGEIDIKKEWGGKEIQITVAPTNISLESPAQTLKIESLYSVTVDEKEEKIAKEGTKISLTAADEVGKKFIKWEAEGVTLLTPTEKAIQFDMPGNNVTLTKVYKTIETVPVAQADYTDMKLTGLTPAALYTIESEEMTADLEGKIAIKKEWSEKNIIIKKNETETETESPEQTVPINKIYSITVNDGEVAISVEGQDVTIKAPTPEGYRFKEWTKAEGVTLPGDVTKETITITILKEDVKLTAEYTQIMMTKPEELEYNGEKEVSVELNVPFAEFEGIMVDGVMLVKDQDYTVSEGSVATLSSGKTIITFTKEYLDKLTAGESTKVTAVLTSGNVDFSIKVSEKPEKPEVPQNPPVDFPDVNDKEWYAKAIDYVSSKEYMTGYADGNFGPADTLGRGQFASILHRIAGSPAENYENLFSDVPNGTFYTMPVVWAQKNEVITGYQNGSFGPSDSMTREQLVTMLYRYTQMKGGNTVARASIDSFPDKSKVSGFAEEAMKWAVAEGLISGDNSALNPQGIASRAVGATLIQRYEMKQNPEVTPPAPDTTTPPVTP